MLAACLGGASGLAAAQPVANHVLTGALGLEESYVDVRARSSGNGGEFVTRITPTVAWASKVGRLQGSLNYSGALLYRSGLEDRDGLEYLNALAANLTLEAIPQHGFIEARAGISQQTLSASGDPVGSMFQSNDNRTEVRTLSVSPYLRGNLTDAAEFELRGAGSMTRSDSPAAVDSHSELGSLLVRSTQRGNRLGWAASVQRQRVGFSNASSATITDRANLELLYFADIDWRFSINGGVEESDVIAGERRRYDNYGASIAWTPSPRTQIVVRGDERYFGHSHSVTVEHRLQRSTFRYTDMRDVNNGADLTALGAANASGAPGFLVNGITVQRRQELSWTLQAVRTTFAISGYRTRTERADTGGVNPIGINDDVEQSGYLGSLAYKLTPDVSITGSGSRNMAQSPSAGTRTDLKSVSAELGARLGRRTTGALTLRYSVHNGTSDPYRESALSGSLSLRF